MNRANLRVLVSELGPLLGLVLTWLLFALLVGGDFLAWDNQRLMLLQTAVVGTAAVGATFIIISGGIDLSVGSTIALGTMVVALLLRAEVPPLLAALGGIGVAALCGAAVGAMVIGHLGRVLALVLALVVPLCTVGHIPLGLALALGLVAGGLVYFLNQRFIRPVSLPPFIVTLGMWGALRGVAKGLGDNQPVYPEHSTWLNELMHHGSTSWTAILAPGVWIFLMLALLMSLVLKLTKFGRHVYAIGSNEQTAHLCGVRVDRTKFWIYVLAIGCAGLASVLQFSYLSMGDPTTAQGYELKVIAAVVIGGASLSGGEGSIRGTLVGAMLMTVVDNGCTKLGLDNWIQEIVTGGIIVTAVALDRLRHR